MLWASNRFRQILVVARFRRISQYFLLVGLDLDGNLDNLPNLHSNKAIFS